MKRAWPVIALTVVVAAVVVVLVRGAGPASPGGTGTPGGPAPVIRPRLRAVTAEGVDVPSGGLIVKENQSFDLRVSVDASAFVYLFDETQNQLTLVWRHPDDSAWEKGEYSADGPAFEGVGEHKLMLVAAPSPQPSIDTWKVLTPDSLRSICPQCEVDAYVLYVKGGGSAPN